MITTEPLEDEQSAQLLAQANLYRMRKQWEEASTCCMQVLYHEPENWRAHALLGDIYLDQSRPEEAIQWYCMTLDIRPDAQSVREKLSNLVTNRRREIVRSIDPTRTIHNLEAAKNQTRISKLTSSWRIPERRRKLALGTVVCAVVFVLLVAILLAGRTKPQSGDIFTSGSTPTDTALVLQPVTITDTAKPAGPTGSTAGAADSTSSQQHPSQAASVAGAGPNSASPGAAPTRDINDAALTAALQSDSSLHSEGIEITDAQVDPAQSSATVTFVSGSGSASQAAILRDAFMAGRAALGRPEATGISACFVRALVRSSGGAAVLTFTGTLPRTALTSVPDDLAAMAPDQLSSMFSSTWWSGGGGSSPATVAGPPSNVPPAPSPETTGNPSSPAAQSSPPPPS